MAFLVPVVLLFAVLAAGTTHAQSRDGRLTVTVSDQTGAVIQNATVMVTAQDNPERAGVVSPVQTSQQGVALLQGLTPGRYLVVIEFPGFETLTIRDVRVRAGENRQHAVLALQKLEDTVTVGQDPQRAASDPRGPAFGTVLTREQIEALSDDPDELKRQLQDMAGPGAVMSVLTNLVSGTPYTLQTGFDDNGDLIFNDRPAGVGRNTERAKGQQYLNANVNYSFTFGRANPAMPPPTAIGITNIGGTTSVQTISVPQNGRYRVNVFATAQNLTNRSNFVGYSGVMTSPFFRQPRDVVNPRRVDFGVNFGF